MVQPLVAIHSFIHILYMLTVYARNIVLLLKSENLPYKLTERKVSVILPLVVHLCKL